MTLFLLKLKKEFENSKLKNVKKVPEHWISDLKVLINEIEPIDKELAISEKEFMMMIKLKLHFKM